MKADVQVKLYSGEGCHLCDSARDVIQGVRRRHRFDFEIVTIDGNGELEARFRKDIPVVHIDDRFAFRYRVDAGELLAKIEKREAER
jgi:glutaredoxin